MSNNVDAFDAWIRSTFVVLRERNRLPVPAVMPTLDPRPLTLTEREQLGANPADAA
jgi:hypothetical protein